MSLHQQNEQYNVKHQVETENLKKNFFEIFSDFLRRFLFLKIFEIFKKSLYQRMAFLNTSPSTKPVVKHLASGKKKKLKK